VHFLYKREKSRRKQKDHRRQTAHQPQSRATPGEKGRGGASSEEQQIWPYGGTIHAI